LILHKVVRFLLQFKKHLPEHSQFNNENRPSSLMFTIPAARTHTSRVRLWKTD